jgi:hypothetical protein
VSTPYSTPGWETVGRRAVSADDQHTEIIDFRTDPTQLGIDAMLASTQAYGRRQRAADVARINTVLRIVVAVTTLAILAVWFL